MIINPKESLKTIKTEESDKDSSGSMNKYIKIVTHSPKMKQ